MRWFGPLYWGRIAAVFNAYQNTCAAELKLSLV